MYRGWQAQNTPSTSTLRQEARMAQRSSSHRLSKRLLISTLGMWAELRMTTPPRRDPIGCLSWAGASLVVCDAAARPELHPQFPVPRRRVLRRARPLHPSHPSRCGVAARAGRAGCGM